MNKLSQTPFRINPPIVHFLARCPAIFQSLGLHVRASPLHQAGAQIQFECRMQTGHKRAILNLARASDASRVKMLQFLHMANTSTVGSSVKPIWHCSDLPVESDGPTAVFGNCIACVNFVIRLIPRCTGDTCLRHAPRHQWMNCHPVGCLQSTRRCKNSIGYWRPLSNDNAIFLLCNCIHSRRYIGWHSTNHQTARRTTQHHRYYPLLSAHLPAAANPSSSRHLSRDGQNVYGLSLS
jgi:hypothetical protein